MNIVIPIKQVPDSNKVKMDPESGTMMREGVEAVVNPLDLYSIQLGVDLKEKYGASITVISMGPPKAAKAIREAISMGCDDGILLSDKKFGGSDTWATSYTIAETIKSLPAYDLVIFGERATDGDTGQVGPCTAAWLDVPLASYVASVDAVTDDSIEVERMVEGGYQKLRLPKPAVLTVVKEIAAPMLPTLSGKKRARRTEIPTYTAESLPFEDANLGLKGSPTRVVKIRTPKVSREGRVVHATDGEGTEGALDELIAYLKEKELV
ncbi:MAG: electron transfer flavoprotein subunit beta/FixA family protein [Spirochaetota bacterium]